MKLGLWSFTEKKGVLFISRTCMYIYVDVLVYLFVYVCLFACMWGSVSVSLCMCVCMNAYVALSVCPPKPDFSHPSLPLCIYKCTTSRHFNVYAQHSYFRMEQPFCFVVLLKKSHGAVAVFFGGTYSSNEWVPLYPAPDQVTETACVWRKVCNH